MNWNGKEIKTMGDVIDAALSAIDEDRASEFKALYIADAEKDRPGEGEAIVNSNLGYMSGYLSPEMGAKVLRAFSTTHPIFGSERPTAQEAFQKGLALGTPSIQEDSNE